MEASDYIVVYSLRHSMGDFTANGVTNEFDSLVLFKQHVTNDQILDWCNERGVHLDTCIRVMDCSNPAFGVRAEIVFKKPNSEGHYSAGGNFVFSSDRRYEQLTGIGYPISVHDRFETWGK